MPLRGLALALAALAAVLALPAAALAARADYIVVYERSVASPAAETARQERTRGFRARFEYERAVKGFAARLSPAQAEALRDDPDVAVVAPDRPVRAVAALSHGETPPTGVLRMRAATSDSAHAASAAGVAVVDTGVDVGHPDLNAVNGIDCVSKDAVAQDPNGHGTHVAGTVGARNQGAGVIGVAPGTPIHAVRVLDAEGNGYTSDIVCGLDWVLKNASTRGIEVVNMSLGGLAPRPVECGAARDPDPMHAAVCRLTAAGILTVAAAGNEAVDFGEDGSYAPPANATVPAVYPEVLTVTALADSDGRSGGAGSACRGEADDTAASFSNFATRGADAAHTIAAPGTCIRSTWPNGRYATISGTSMAAPHVAGAASLCISEAGQDGPCAGKTPAEIRALLLGDAEAAASADPGYGFGGDPLTPIGSAVFGYLALGGPPTALTDPPPPEPEPETTQTDTQDPAPATEAPAGTDSTTGAGTDSGSGTGAERGGTSPVVVIDTTAPTATLATARRRLRALRRRGLRVVVSCSESCSARARLVVSRKKARRLGLKRRRLVRAGAAALAAKQDLTLRPGRRVRKRLRGKRRLRATLVVTVTDAAGNARRHRRAITLRR